MNDLKNIFKDKKSGLYYIKKWKNRRGYYFGSYHSLEDAIKVRNVLRSVNWGFKKDPMEFISWNKNKNRWVVQKRTVAEGVLYYGTFKTLEEAQDERDLLVKADWDIDNVGDITEVDSKYSKPFKTARKSPYKPQSDYYKPFFKGQQNCNALISDEEVE